MVKFSFGISSGKSDEKGDIKVSNKLSSVFSKPEDASKDKVKKHIITELSATNNNSNYDSENEELNKYVIPCKNSLKDLKEEKNTDKPPEKPLGELKYGLNILYNNDKGELEDKNEETQSRDTSLNNEEDDTSYKSKKRGLEYEEGTLEENRDDEIAKKIIEEFERKKLKEELFGSRKELIEKSEKTVPILLRNKNKVNEELKTSNELKKDNKNLDIKSLLEVKMDQYENVPVENFGLAMLLGMGYDPRKKHSEPKVYKKRIFERGGLGSDSVMKTNMECLMDANLMAKLKKDHVYNIVEGTSEVNNWALPGIWAKITDKNHEKYKEKGLVKSVNKNMVSLIVGESEVQIHFKHLETVVSRNTKLCKVVRRVPNSKKKEYIEVGTLVKVVKVMEERAKVIFEGEEVTVSLDSISEFQE